MENTKNRRLTIFLEHKRVQKKVFKMFMVSNQCFLNRLFSSLAIFRLCYKKTLIKN